MRKFGNLRLVEVEVAKDLARAVREALGKHGAAARVEVREGRVWLVMAAGSVSVEVGPLLDQWALLPPDVQNKKAAEIAAALREHARHVGPGVAFGDFPVKPRMIAVGIGGVVTMLFFALVVMWWLDTGEPPVQGVGPDASAEPAGGPADDERTRRVCEAARKRLIAGAKVGALDSSGWVVELWLSGPDAAKLRSTLTAAVAEGGTLGAPADAELKGIAGGHVAVGPGLKISEAGEPIGSTLTLSGGYSSAYMDPLTRAHMMAFAEALADKAGADHAALYARCQHLSHNDMGAWFRGSDSTRAATSMMFVTGAFADSPALDRAKLAADPKPLVALNEAASGVDTERLAVLVGTDGGAISSRKEPPSVTVTFSAAVSTKALVATRVITQDLKLDR